MLEVSDVVIRQRTYNSRRKCKICSPALFSTPQHNAFQYFMFQHNHGPFTITRIPMMLYWCSDKLHCGQIIYTKRKKILSQAYIYNTKVGTDEVKANLTLFHQQKCLTDLCSQYGHVGELQQIYKKNIKVTKSP